MADDEFMTTAEFAALTSDAHHAVWKARADGLTDPLTPWQGETP